MGTGGSIQVSSPDASALGVSPLRAHIQSKTGTKTSDFLLPAYLTSVLHTQNFTEENKTKHISLKVS